MSENKRVTIPFLAKALKPIVDLVRTKADKTDILQPDWNQADDTKNDFIKNKPNFNDILEIDSTLSLEGAAADAKVVGEALAGKQPIGEYALKDDVVQPDWSQNDENAADYVKNRTHYVESVEEIVNLPETTLELLDGSSDEFAITTPFFAPIEVDTTYNIVYNGSKYECKAQSFTAGAQTATVLGNVGAQTGGTDTGEPFVVIVTPDELVSEVGCYAMVEVADSAETITISISTTKEIVKTIDPKYLANGKDKHKYLTTDENGNAKWEQMLTWAETSVIEVLPETEFTFDESGEGAITEPVARHPEVGNTCIVTFNGVEYETVATELEEGGLTAILLGNLSLMNQGPDTGEPFMVMIPSEELIPMLNGMTCMVGILDKGSIISTTISIKENAKVYRKISSELLPTPDWNAKEGEEGYIANKTHYAYAGTVEVLPECSITEDDESATTIPLSEALVDGKQYKVTYNGVEYNTTATSVDLGGITAVCMGNIAAMDTGEIGDGEPFIFIEVPAALTAQMGQYWVVNALDETTSVTIKIEYNGEVIKRIDQKFLPQYDWNASKGEDGYIENRTHYINQTDVEIMPETTFTGISGENIINATTSNFTAGTNCVVTWNGVDYECVIQSGANSINEDMLVAYVGNGTRLGGVKTDDPFLFAKLTPAGAAQVGGGYVLYAMDGSTTVTMKIVEPAGMVHKLDPIYLPDIPCDLNFVNGEAEGSVRTSYALPEGTITNSKKYYLGRYAFAEGQGTHASGEASHAEGYSSEASGEYSHAEGSYTTASGHFSHTEGRRTTASAQNTHAEGYCTIAASATQHVQGRYNIEDTSVTYAHIVGNGESDTTRSNAHTLDWDGNAWYAGDVLVGGTSQEDAKVLATKEYVDEQMATAGSVSSVNGKTGAVELTAADVGALPSSTVIPSVEGLATESYVDEKVASVVESAPETLNTLNELAAALGDDPNFATTVSTQIGNKVDKTTTVNGKALSGSITLSASDVGADAAGTAQAKINELYIKNGNNNSLVSAWAETESDTYSHGYHAVALGNSSRASGAYSHAEGSRTIASGNHSHAEGHYTKASGQESHAEGNYTIAASHYQHVQGRYNVEDADGVYAHIVGNGSSSTRSNAHTLDWQGNAWFQGNVYVGGTNQDEGSEKLLTQSEVNSIINELLAAILPTPTIEDAGKVLRVNEEGKYELVAPLTNEEIDDICGSTVQVSSEMVDEATGESYRLYVSNGELKMEKVV